MDGWRDHGLFYYSPRLFLQGRNAYDWDAMKGAWARDGKPTGIDPGTTMSGYVTPPSMALLTLVPAMAPPRFGYRSIDSWNLVALAACLYFLIGMAGRRWPLEVKILFAAFVIALPDVAGVLLLGQTTLVVCACLSGALYLFSRSRRPAAGGIGIGLALAKFTLSFPFLALLAYRRKWRALILALAVCLFANLLFAVPGGVGATLTGFREAIARENRPGTSYDAVSSNAKYMPDTLVHLKRLLYLALGARRPLIDGLNVLLTVGAAAVMAYVMRPRNRQKGLIEEPLEIGLLAVSSLLLFYHRTYDLAALILLGYALVDEGVKEPRRRTAVWVAMTALFVLLAHSAKIVFGLARWLPATANASAMLCWINCLSLVILFVLCAYRLHTIRRHEQTPIEGEPA